MKKIAFYAFALCLPFCANGQLKHDFIWTLGCCKVQPTPSGEWWGGILMDFSSEPPSLTPQDFLSIREALACISDKNGNLVAYTNGCKVTDRKHKTMLNGDKISPGVVQSVNCSIHYPVWQGCLFLPAPGSDSLYYLFHLRDDDWNWDPMHLMYSVIDASAEGGDGAVISKNNIVFDDSLYLGNYVTATKHANGRDWWVVSPRRFSNGIHAALLTPEGIAHSGMRDVPFGKIDSAYWGSQTAFSPDGSKYFRNSFDGLLMLDFDRCDGRFSNPVYLDWKKLPPAGRGVAVSPNNRFVYVNSGLAIYQYDLQAPDLAGSGDTVAVYDGFKSPFPTYFVQMASGPDGKIYLTSSNNNILHVIHWPDEKGTACGVEQHGLTLPSLNGPLALNFANYNLGPLEAPCDMAWLGIGEPPSGNILELKPWPNPAGEVLNIEIPASVEWVQVRDAVGRSIAVPTMVIRGRTELNTAQLRPGIYFVTASASGRLWKGKFVRL